MTCEPLSATTCRGPGAIELEAVGSSKDGFSGTSGAPQEPHTPAPQTGQRRPRERSHLLASVPPGRQCVPARGSRAPHRSGDPDSGQDRVSSKQSSDRVPRGRRCHGVPTRPHAASFHSAVSSSKSAPCHDSSSVTGEMAAVARELREGGWRELMGPCQPSLQASRFPLKSREGDTQPTQSPGVPRPSKGWGVFPFKAVPLGGGHMLIPRTLPYCRNARTSSERAEFSSARLPLNYTTSLPLTDEFRF